MPYASQAQRGYFNANREKLERQGVDVDEWNKASKGKKLPARSRSERASSAKKARRHKETIYGSPSASGTTPHLRN